MNRLPVDSIKRCPRCAGQFPRFDFGVKKDGGVQAYCRPCQSGVAKEKNARISEQRAKAKQEKDEGIRALGRRCVMCDQHKPPCEFQERNDRLGGIESRCRQCKSQGTAKWRDQLAQRMGVESYRQQERARRKDVAERNGKEVEKQIRQRWRANQRESFGDWYVRKIVSEKGCRSISAADIPQALVDAYREVLRIKRFIVNVKEPRNENSK